VIGKNKIKLIRSLEFKKFRTEHNLFLAEGNKLVAELVASDIEMVLLYGTPDFLSGIITPFQKSTEIVETSRDEIKKASLLKNPQEALALCRIPGHNINLADPARDWVLGLDNLQDPGNLGTIVRLADWFGIIDIVCSNGSADIFNPKAVQATMGSICRVRVHYTELPEFSRECNGKGLFTGGTFMDGENLFNAAFPENGLVIMGNEGHGIGSEVEQVINRRLSIPFRAAGPSRAESLNVAAATALVCAEIRRESLKR
jgi:RNA methyltransferase, TrmH family